MCELLALSSRRPTRLTFSLATLAARGAPAGRTHDGWGVALYQDHDVALFREPTAAGTSPLVRFLQTQAPDTTLAVSHIRRVTRGAIALANTQPFARELAGRMHVFAHNGDLPAIEQSGNFALDRYRPVGTTDSEYAFCALLARLGGLWNLASPAPSLERRRAVVAEFATELRKLGPANFLYADGDTLFAHGHRRIQPSGSIAPPGLFLLSRRCTDLNESVQAAGVSVAPGFQEVLLIASVPLTDEQWRPVAEGEVVAVAGGKILGAGVS